MPVLLLCYPTYMHVSQVILDRLIEIDAQIASLRKANADLEAVVRQQDRTITGIKHYLKIAADYKNDDPVKVAEAIQAALSHASKYEGRKQNGKRDRRK